MKYSKAAVALAVMLSLSSCIGLRPADENYSAVQTTEALSEAKTEEASPESGVTDETAEGNEDESFLELLLGDTSEETEEDKEDTPPPLDAQEKAESEKLEFEQDLLNEIYSDEVTETDSAEQDVISEPDSETDAFVGMSENITEPQTETKGEFAGKSVTFTAAGDNLVHPNIYIDASYRDYYGNGYNFKPMYDDVAELIASADVAFINQETIMAGADYGYSGWPCFNSPRQLAYDLVDIGFDVVNIANNHMLDKGASGLESAIEFWNTLSTTLVGGYLNQEDAERIRVTETNGIKFAWLAYTGSTNGIVKSASSEAVIPYIDDSLILSDLARAEEAGDFTVVSIHWGVENTQTPTDEQVRVAKLLAENGADVIIGHHSHTLQPIEWIETERGRTLCIYSLGTLVSGMASPVNMVAGFANFTVCGDENGNLTVDDVYFTPTVFYYGMDWYNTHIYLLDDYTEAIAAGHGLGISGYTLSPESAMTYVRNAISDEFLK